MTDLSASLRGSIEQLGLQWATEYGALVTSSTSELAAFFSQVAGVAAEAAIEGDEDALDLLKVAGYSMLASHKIKLASKNRATIQRGLRLLVSVVSILAQGLASSATEAVSRALPQSEQ